MDKQISYDPISRADQGEKSDADQCPPTNKKGEIQVEGYHLPSRDAQSPDAAGQHSDPQRGATHSVGITNLMILVGGPIISVATLAFLLYLWAGRGSSAKGDEAGYAWRSFVYNGWLIQTVTICSLILRTCLLVPTTLCTSMVASLMMEKRGVPLVHAASMAVHRSVNSGVLSFMEAFLGKRGMLRLLFSPEGFAITLLAACHLALLFTSTILLSDISTPPMADFGHPVDYALLNKPGFPFLDTFGMERSADALSVFGESSRGYVASPKSNRLSDTGLKRHVMIPFDRDPTSIYSLQGPMMVMDSRVQCLPPVMGTNITIQPWFEVWPNQWKLYGTINYEETARKAGIDVDDSVMQRITDTNTVQSLECVVIQDHPSLCMLRSRNEYSKPWKGSDGSRAWESDPYMFLALRATDTPFLESENMNSTRLDMRLSPTEQDNGGGDDADEWLTLGPTDNPDADNMRVSASLCFYNHNVSLYDVSLFAGDATLSSPRLSWPPAAFVNFSGPADSSSPLDPVLWKLGADPSLEGLAYDHPDDYDYDYTNAETRGILRVDSIDPAPFAATSSSSGNVGGIIISPETASDAGRLLQRSAELAFYNARSGDGGLLQGPPSITVGDCENEEYEYQFSTSRCGSLSPSYQGVIDRAILKHGRPGVGIQSFFRLLMQFTHDQFLAYEGSGDGDDDDDGLLSLGAMEVRLSPKNVPVAFRGYAVVAVLWLVTTVVMAGITVAYVKGSRYSMLDHFWYSVAQVGSPATEDVLDSAGRGVQGDGKIGKHGLGGDAADEIGGKERLVKLGRVPGTGRIGLVPVGQEDDGDQDGSVVR